MLASLLAALAAVSHPGNALPADAAEALHRADSAVLYSLEPWDEPVEGRPALHGVHILGQARIEGENYQTAAAAFEKAVTTADPDGPVAACFDPRHALRVVSGGHEYEFLLCYACAQIRVYRDGEVVASLRAAGSSKPMNALLAAMKLPLSKSYDEDADAAAALKSQKDRQRWVAATPQSLSALEPGPDPLVSQGDIARMATALAKQYPNASQRILALYAWFGSGAGPWSGFPSYESVAEELLMKHSTEALLAPLDSPELSETQLEGAARLLGGWIFWNKRPDDLKQLSPELKKRLLAQAMRGGNDKDKHSRAQRAFGSR